MDVVTLEARLVRIELRRPVQHASHARTFTDNLVVCCRLSDGTIGYGEGVPRDYVTGETAESSFRLLQETDWKYQLPPCQSVADVIQLAERLTLPEVMGDTRSCQANAARCAVELALLDAFGRSLRFPLKDVTKLAVPTLYQLRERVQYSGIVLTSKPWKAGLFALGQRLYGLRQLKVKVGVAGADDVRRLHAIRRWAGRQLRLRVDANEVWPASQAAARIRELEPFDLEYIEQPVRHEEAESLAELRKNVCTPIMLDESLCSMIDAQQAIQHHLADAFNLRLSKCGGFIRTLRLAQLARSANIAYQLGCQVGETGILSAAGRHFACSVRDIAAHEGSYDRRLVHQRLTRNDLTFGRSGLAPTLTGFGLGITVNTSELDACTRHSEVLFRAG